MGEIENVTAGATIKYRGVEADVVFYGNRAVHLYKGGEYDFCGFRDVVDAELLKEFDEAEHLSRSERALKYLVGKEVVVVSKISGVHKIGVLKYHGDGVCTVDDFGLDCDDIDTCHVVVIELDKVDEGGKTELENVESVRLEARELRNSAYLLECEVKDLVTKFVEKYGN